MHEKRWLRCCLRLLDIVNFWKFSTLGPYNSETGGRTTTKFLLNLLRVVKNVLEQKLFCFIFFTTRHKILPFGKKLPRSKFFTQFLFSLNPPLSDFKVKFRGHPFAYTLTNTGTGLIHYLLTNNDYCSNCNIYHICFLNLYCFLHITNL